ncbi:MAG: ribosome maturation factor RimM [Parvularculaceae bacterium]
MARRLICIGAIAGAFGAKGEVRLKSFTEDPRDIASYGPLYSEDGEREFRIGRARVLKGDMLAGRIEGVETREQAAALKSTRLFAPREALPAPEPDEFYFEDLVGLKAETADGRPFGAVRAAYNFGAGDIIEIAGAPGEKGPLLLPFTKEIVPRIDLDAGVIVVAPPSVQEDDHDPVS